jgi:hypothetical protein
MYLVASVLGTCTGISIRQAPALDCTERAALQARQVKRTTLHPVTNYSLLASSRSSL